MEIDKKIEELIVLEREQISRKEEDKICRYNTALTHRKQMLFHKCGKRARWVFGGNRSGKTECGAVETVWRLRGIHPYLKNRGNVSGWVVSLSQQVSRDVAQRKILEYLPKRYIAEIVMNSGSKGNFTEGVIDYILVKNVFGGLSRLGFRSCDQGREKFQGASLDFIWIDEEPPKEIYEECRMRLLDRRGDIWVTMTPLKGLNWVYESIYQNNSDTELWHINMEWADNPYLDASEIERMSKILGAEELDSRRYGKFSGLGGLVYREFDESIHIIEPVTIPKEWFDMISIDPGLNNPLSAHWYAVDWDGNIYVLAEHYLAGKDIDFHSDCIKRISKNLGWQTDSKGNLNALIDSAAAAVTLSGTKSVSELFIERGINVNHKVNKDIFSGITRVKYYLKGEKGKPKLYIFSHCVNMIKEFRSYRWAAGDMPKKENDHSLDELRYYIMSKPIPPEIQVQKSIITLHKEKMMRKLNRRVGKFEK